MNTVDAKRIGIIFGAVLGGYHLLWSLLVAAGVAQRLLDFVFWMHFLKPVFVLEPFGLTRAVTLVLVTTAVGYAFGWTFGVVWNASRIRA